MYDEQSHALTHARTRSLAQLTEMDAIRWRLGLLSVRQRRVL